MDRRDFLKLFALSAAGLYVPTRSYFFMSNPNLTAHRFRGKQFLIDSDNSGGFSDLRIASIYANGGYLIPPELGPIVDQFIKVQSQISRPFIIPIEKQESVGSKQWLKNIKKLRS